MFNQIEEEYNLLKKQIEIVYKNDMSHGPLRYDPLSMLLRKSYNAGVLSGYGLKERKPIDINLGVCFLPSEKKPAVEIQADASAVADINLNINTIWVVEKNPSFLRRVKIAFGLFKRLKNFNG